MESQLTQAFYQMIQPYVQHFRPQVAATFLSLALAWAAAPRKPRTSRLLRVIGSQLPSHPTTYYRFFSQTHWGPDALAIDLFRRSLTLFPNGPITIRLIFDDTLLKKTGPRVFGAAMFRDAVLSTQAKVVTRWGLNWVVMVLAVPDPEHPQHTIPIPLMSRLFLTKACCEEYKSPSQLAVEMLSILHQVAPERISFRLCGDGAYTNEHFLSLELPNVSYTGRLRADARLQKPLESRKPKGKGRPPSYGDEYDAPKKLIKTGGYKRRDVSFVGYSGQETTRKVIVLGGTYRECSSTRRLRFLLVKPGGRGEKPLFLVTTDLKSPLCLILEDFVVRWCCEVCFREAKQDMEVECSQVYAEDSVRRQTPFGFWMMGMIKLWYLEQRSKIPDVRLETAWYEPGPRVSFEQMRASLHYVLWRTLLKGEGKGVFDSFGQPEDSEEMQSRVLRLFCGC